MNKATMAGMALYSILANVLWWGTIIAGGVNLIWLFTKDELLLPWWMLMTSGGFAVVMIIGAAILWFKLKT